MKKIIFTLAVVFAMAIPAVADSYLYWMTDMTDERYKDSSYYDTVKIIAKDVVDGGATTYTALGFYAGNFDVDPMGSLSYDNVNDAPGMGITGYYADLSGISESATFYIELFKDGSSVAISDSILYSTAANFILDIDPSGMFVPTSAPWSVKAPEPTSGLLMLLGMAALGLKRRKMTNA